MSEETARTLLCVDDEQRILNALKRLLRNEGYRILTATSGQEGLDLLKENNVQIVVSDQRMPEMNGTELMAMVKASYPDILRIILTGYTDVDSITESINKGHVYKFFLKPWNDQNLKLEIRQAFEQYELMRTNERLDKTVLEQNRQLLNVNENLERLVGERTQDLVLQTQALTLSHDILEAAPIPIVGVDGNGIIVLTNQAARNTTEKTGIHIGIRFDTCFPDHVNQALETVLSAKTAQAVDATMDHSHYRISMAPLIEKGRQGAIITMVPVWT